MNARNKLLQAVFLVGLLAGCASTGGNTESGFRDKLYIGYATNAEVRNTAATLVRGKVMGSAEGQAVQELANNARGVLDIAKTYNDAKDTVKAAANLNLATDILNRLKSFVNEKAGGAK